MKTGRLLFAVMAAGVLTRAAILLWGPRELLARPWEYETVAQNLFMGKGFQIQYLKTTTHALVHPFYPWFCAGLYGLVGHPSIQAVQWAQAALAAPAAWVVFQIGKELGSKKAGILAAAGVVLHPGLLIYSLRPHPLWLDSLCFLTILWLALRAGGRSPGKEGWAGVFALGGALGWGLLSRSTVVAALPFMLAWLWVRWKGQADRLKRIAAIIGVAGAIAFPWVARNWIVVGRPVGMLSSSAFSFWVGNHPGATGSAVDSEGRSLLFKMPPEFRRQVNALDEKGQVAFFTREAFSFIRRQPGLALKRDLKKWLQFWSGSPRTGAWYPSLWTRGYAVYYWLLLAFTGLGAFILWTRGQGSGLFLIASFALAVSILQSLVFVEGRHRWEVESFLVVIASFGVARAFLRMGD